MSVDLASFGIYEIILQRIALAWLCYRTLVVKRVGYEAYPVPVGAARFFDLVPLGSDSFFRGARPWVVALLAAYVVGLAPALVVTCLALLHVAKWTLRNSQGASLHEQQGLTMVLVFQAGVYLYWGVAYGTANATPWSVDPASDRTAVLLSQQAVLAVYFTSGLTKLATSRIGWIVYSPRIVLQIVKAGRQRFYDGLDPTVMERSRSVVGFVLGHRFLCAAILTAGLMLELVSPAFMFGRTMNVVGGCLLIGFHVSIRLVMGLRFSEQMALVAIYLVNLPYFVLRALGMDS